MNLTHLVLFHFWAGAGGDLPPGTHTPFILVSVVTSQDMLVTVTNPLEVQVAAWTSFDILGSVDVPLSAEVEVSPSFRIQVEVT